MTINFNVQNDVIRNGDKTYSVNWRLVYSILRSYHFATARRRHRIIETTHDSNLGREVHSWDVDWDSVRYDADFDTRRWMSAWLDLNNIQRLQGNLREFIRQAAIENAEWTRFCRSIVNRNMGVIHDSVSRLEDATQTLKMIRNWSGEILMIGAVVLTGGAAAVAVAAAGSALKGVGTYQDTQKVGAAVVDAVGSLALALVPIAKGGASQLSSRATYLLILADTGVDASKNYLSGDNAKQIAGKVVGKLAGGAASVGIGNVFNSESALKMIGRVGIPFKARATPLNMQSIQQRADMSSGIISKGIELHGINPVVDALTAPNRQAPLSQGGVCLANEIAINTDLADKAIIRMPYC